MAVSGQAAAQSYLGEVQVVAAGAVVAAGNPLPSAPVVAGAVVATANPLPISNIVNAAAVSPSNPIPSSEASGVPVGVTQLNASSGNIANASAAATLAAAVGKTTYISGFEVTASGATAGLPVSVTVAGLLGGTATYTFVFPAGVLVSAQPLIVQFLVPLAASALNTAIVVTCPASGAGGTNCTVNAHGFQL